MKPETLKRILKDLHDGSIGPEEAFRSIKHLPYENMEFARVDHHRAVRSGLPEVIYCQGKTPKQILAILRSLKKSGHNLLATKLLPETFQKIKKELPGKAEYNLEARTLVIRQKTRQKKEGLIVVVSAGTSDIPVALEAAVTAETFGSRVETVFDVGVAGIHRLIDNLDRLREARVVVAVAGMDGALASVVGGLLEQPVSAIPTSVGYGASFGGVAALLTMLNSCASGIAVVNIDNGFGAGCLAHKINLLAGPKASV
ncbi:MAG: nickel pincer cofactor biosynthesis protein LarB [Nitrospinaceae bacterium]|nr:MAG: nickel pincer cofactor biosynthesis protein LarB [Nitrospinaceae bacterium]